MLGDKNNTDNIRDTDALSVIFSNLYFKESQTNATLINWDLCLGAPDTQGVLCSLSDSIGYECSATDNVPLLPDNNDVDGSMLTAENSDAGNDNTRVATNKENVSVDVIISCKKSV